MDIGTIVGIVSAFGLVLIAIFMGGGIGMFINIPSLMIVAGGTLGTTMINYPLKEVLGAVKIFKKVFFATVLETDTITKQFVEFGNKARREGILALESDIKEIDDIFLERGIQLSVDGLEPQTIYEIMSTEVDFIKERHQLGAEIFSTMGTFAPALGMIGTLVGLVQMLQNMDDPSSIGPSMAVALLTTFYGSVFANLIFMPMAGKLRTRSKEETLVKEMITEGVVSLTKGDNPRIIEQKLLAFMSPNLRETGEEE